MHRKQFLKSCSFSCLAITGITTAVLLQACSSTKKLTGAIEKDDLIVDLSVFENSDGKKKKYVIVSNDILQYPICVYQQDAENYTALWMKCTHQGATLQVFGDQLQCPAHGSEFASTGAVTSGPANTALRRFPVVRDGNRLKISLKAI